MKKEQNFFRNEVFVRNSQLFRFGNISSQTSTEIPLLIAVVMETLYEITLNSGTKYRVKVRVRLIFDFVSVVPFLAGASGFLFFDIRLIMIIMITIIIKIFPNGDFLFGCELLSSILVSLILRPIK